MPRAPKSATSATASAPAAALAALCQPLAPRPVSRWAVRVERVALALWLGSFLLPVARGDGTVLYGWQLALSFVNPFLLLYSPLAFLSVWMNFVFLHQLRGILDKDRSRAKRPSSLVVSIAAVVAFLGIISGGPMLPQLLAQPAAWVWAASFVVLLVAAVLYET